MGATPILPSADVLARQLKPGVTQQDLANKYGVSRTAISKRLSRGGKTRRMNRHTSLIPWQLEAEHTLDYAARMLRAEGRRRLGLAVNEHDGVRLAAWKKGLAQAGAVVVYVPDHRAKRCKQCHGVGGFHRVRREEAVEKWGEPCDAFDTDLIFVTQRQGEEILRRRARSA